jgi:integral membrane protein (TIGR01906 family)
VDIKSLVNSNIKKTAIAVNSILLLIIIVLSPLAYYLYNFNFYNSLFVKNGVYEILDKSDVKKLTENVYDYFKYKRDFETFELKGNIKFFNETEISHLNDVRILLKKLLTVFYISTALFVLLTILLVEKKTNRFLKNISLSALISSAALICLFILFYFFGNNFWVLFEKFHYIFFPQGNWAFPEGSLIITIFPFGFFYDFFFKLITVSLVIAGVLLAGAIAGTLVANSKAKAKN